LDSACWTDTYSDDEADEAQGKGLQRADDTHDTRTIAIKLALSKGLISDRSSLAQFLSDSVAQLSARSFIAELFTATCTKLEEALGSALEGARVVLVPC